MSTQRTWYLHLLNGRAAKFDEKTGRLYYASGRQVIALVPTLRQLNAEQKRSAAAYRDYTDRYHYVRVRLPE